MSEQTPADPDTPTRPSSERGTSDVETPQPDDAKPFFVVEYGNLTPEEIAALTVVLAAATAGGEDEPDPTPVRGWASPARQMRSIISPGYGAWRAEYQPR